MKTIALTVLGISTLLLKESALQAQHYYSPPEGAGLYLRAGLGGTLLEDGKLTDFGGVADNRIEYEVGIVAQGAVGYAFNQYLATELEFGFIGAEIDSVSGLFADNTYLYNMPMLANVVFSFPIPQTVVVPYVGVGAGGAVTVFDTDGFGDNSVMLFGNDSDVVFAWQAFAGLRFELNDHMSLGLGYKYFAADDASFKYGSAFPGGPDFKLGLEGVTAHSLFITFQFRF